MERGRCRLRHSAVRVATANVASCPPCPLTAAGMAATYARRRPVDGWGVVR